MTLRAQVFQVIYDATRDRQTVREMGGVFEKLDPYVDRVMALLAAPVRDAAESAKIVRVDDCLASVLASAECDCIPNEFQCVKHGAMDEVRAIRARVAGLEAELDAQQAMSRVLRTERDAARALLAVELRANAKLRVALELSRCECSVSVQPPHAFKCGRCSALDDERLRALAQPRAERETKDV